MGDPSLLKLLTLGCGGVAMSVTSDAECRQAAIGAMPASLACCYGVTWMGICKGRQITVEGVSRVAVIARRTDWTAGRDGRTRTSDLRSLDGARHS